MDISDVWDKKVDALDAHTSQMYEWMPWTEGTLDQVPQDPAARKQWLSSRSGRPYARRQGRADQMVRRGAGCARHPRGSVRTLRVRPAAE